MNKWPLYKIDDLFEVARGGSPRPIDKFITEDSNGINWVMIGDASEHSKYITSTKKKILPEGAKKSREVKPGDFLLTNSMSFGKPYIMKTSGCIHDGWLLLRPKADNIDPNFFYYLLGSSTAYSEFERLAAGATVKNLNSNLVKSVEIPLPPLEEQRRIAAILDQADALRKARRRAITRLNDLSQSIFYDMFGDPATNPMGWPVMKLGEIGNLDRGVSRHRPRNDPKLLGGAHPLIQTGDVSNADRYIQSYSSTYSDLGLMQSKIWPLGTLCITIAANIGKTAILGIDACFPDSVVGFIPGKKTNAEYVQYWMDCIQQRLEEIAPQSAQKNINLAILRDLLIPVPPIELQEKFRKFVFEIASRKKFLNNSENFLCELFLSLQHRAFNGELTGSAEELLKPLQTMEALTV